MMYSELVKSLRDSEEWATKDGGIPVGLIYRLSQAADAIKELQKERDNWKATAEDWRDAYYHWFENYQNDVPKWIPATEQLPNEKDDVLIYGEWAGASGNIYREVWLTDLKTFLHRRCKPIAWMPLPEPPKEETE